jgi:hypothetical protein
MQHNLCQLHCSSVGPCRHRGHDLDPIAARPRPAQESLQCLRVVAHSPGKPDQKVIISLPLPSTMLVRHRAWASKLERSPINPVIRGSVLRCTSCLASAAARAFLVYGKPIPCRVRNASGLACSCSLAALGQGAGTKICITRSIGPMQHEHLLH